MRLSELYKKHQFNVHYTMSKYNINLNELRYVLESYSNGINFCWIIQEIFSIEKSIENWFSFSPSMMKYIFENKFEGKFNLGKEIEIKGCKFLSYLGFEIIILNYSTKNGEIDIICREKDKIRFVEVKGSFSGIVPEEKIDGKKINKILSVSEDFSYEVNCFDVGYDALFFDGREFRYYKDFLLM